LLIIIGIKRRSLFGTIISKSWIQKCDCKIAKFYCCIDNAPVHITNENIQLSNVTLHFLPPNTTSHLQSCNAGIINSFKISIFFFFYYFLMF
jgi:hypothetical protein